MVTTPGRGRTIRRRFDGKLVAISGGASGLGSALGRAFGRRGAMVALLDLDGAGADAAAKSLRVEVISTRGVVSDVTAETAVARAFADVRFRCSPIDVVIANAGITHRSAFAKSSPTVLQRIMDVNFFRGAPPDPTAARGLAIGISSVAGFSPLIARSVYVASKHALAGQLESMRSELVSQGVGVLVVYPPLIDTPIAHRALSGDGGQAAHAPVAIGRRTTPDEPRKSPPPRWGVRACGPIACRASPGVSRGWPPTAMRRSWPAGSPPNSRTPDFGRPGATPAHPSM